ncbi:hypothetical protein MTO96_032304, partial [Rhipicephalus appendiculatus]
MRMKTKFARGGGRPWRTNEKGGSSNEKKKMESSSNERQKARIRTADSEKHSGSDESEGKYSSSEESQQSLMAALMEDKKMHGMIVAVGIGMAVVIGVILVILLLVPPTLTHARHKPPPQPSAREYTLRDHSHSREEVPAERRHARKPSPQDDDYDEMRRKKVRLAAQKAVSER